MEKLSGSLRFPSNVALLFAGNDFPARDTAIYNYKHTPALP